MFTGPNIVKNGLVLWLDAANTKSYPGSGTTWTDMSGNNNSGSLVNGPSYNNQFLGSVSFDGADDYMTIANITNSTSGFTWDFWINIDVNQPNYPNFWCYFYTLASNNIEIGVYNSGSVGNYFNMSNYGFAPTRPGVSVPIIRGTWTNIVLGCNNFIPFIYNNASSYMTASAFDNYSIRIGELFRSQFYLTRNIKGSLASFKSYNRALSQAEVQQKHVSAYK
jgi:hypothetical protein